MTRYGIFREFLKWRVSDQTSLVKDECELEQPSCAKKENLFSFLAFEGLRHQVTKKFSKYTISCH